MKSISMKTVSVKLDNKIFEDMEEVTAKMNLAKKKYINEAVSLYNNFNKRRLIKKSL